MVQFLINEPHPHPCPQSELPVHLVTFLQMPSQNVNIWAGSFELSPLPSNPIPTLTLSQLHLLFYGENKSHRKRNTSTSSPYFLTSKGVWIIALFFSTSEGEVVPLLRMVKPPHHALRITFRPSPHRACSINYGLPSLPLSAASPVLLTLGR